MTMFQLNNVAVAYAEIAERLAGENPDMLNARPELIPIVVGHLFQSLEISIKHSAIEAGLYTLKESRDRQYGNGHGIDKLAELSRERLRAPSLSTVVTGLTFGADGQRIADFISRMISSQDLEATRRSYEKRGLAYGQLSAGDFAIIQPIPDWIDAVKNTALNLEMAIKIFKMWSNTECKPGDEDKHFAILL